MSKAFSITLANGVQFYFCKTFSKKKSYDFLVSTENDNVYYKVGNITDIDRLKEVLYEQIKANKKTNKI